MIALKDHVSKSNLEILYMNRLGMSWQMILTLASMAANLREILVTSRSMVDGKPVTRLTIINPVI